MSKKLHRAVVLTKFNPRKDKSATLTFETSEQTPEDIGELHALTGTYGCLVFKSENQLTDSEMKELDSLNVELGGKTKSKRLQNILFRLWEKKGESYDTFEKFYAWKMEVIISHLKNQLE